jgi:hypothetical protein
MVPDTVAIGIFIAFFVLIVLLDMAWFTFLIVRAIRQTRKVVALKRTGYRVIAQVAKISREFVHNPRGWSPGRFGFAWYVEAQWTDPRTGIPYEFRSEALHRRQAKLYTIGERISVLIDPADPNRYYVERAH